MDYLKILTASLLSAVTLFALAKLMGNKQISQLNTFDYITGITIGSIAAEMATDLEDHLFQNILAMAVYALIAVGISLLTSKTLWARSFFTGKPVVLLRQGKLYKRALKKSKIDLNEFLGMARLAGFFDLNQLETAVFEHNGNISFLPKAAFRPANPSDFGMAPQRETLFMALIVDGKVIPENLRQMGRDEKWLEVQLKDRGYSAAHEVFLLMTDSDDNTVAFAMKT